MTSIFMIQLVLCIKEDSENKIVEDWLLNHDKRTDINLLKDLRLELVIV